MAKENTPNAKFVDKLAALRAELEEFNGQAKSDDVRRVVAKLSACELILSGKPRGGQHGKPEQPALTKHNARLLGTKPGRKTQATASNDRS